ncbi:hypothetical protein ERU66_06025 [Escherichia coli]|nr:hypothetical protein [Escherichia coli]EKY5144956.1 hypothetical protein [Escherichia coli]
MTFDELEAKGAELVEQRNKATGGAERELLNKEIASIRQAQIQALADECVEAFNIAIPEMVKQAIQSSDVVKQIEELQRGE